MINAPNRPICSVRSAPNAEPARPSFCLSATPKPCSFISTRSPQGSPLALTQSSSSIRLAGTAPKISRFHQPIAPAAAAACAGAQPPRKHLAVHATELAVQSHLQILRRYRRSLLLRLEHADRSALENHVHRTPRLGNRRSANLRVGIRPGITGKFTGNFAQSGPQDIFGVQSGSEFNGLWRNSLRNGTGNFCSHIFKEQGISRWKQGNSANSSAPTRCHLVAQPAGPHRRANVGVALRHYGADQYRDGLPC